MSTYGYPHDKGLKHPLGHARGLGSAKDGAHHWWAQRVTSIALIPLCLWLFAVILSIGSAPREEFLLWLARPLNAGLMVLSIGLLFLHSAQGLQVIIEDYVSAKALRVATLLIMKALHALVGFAAIFAVCIHAF